MLNKHLKSLFFIQKILPNSIRGIVILLVSLALFPALSLLIYSGYKSSSKELEKVKITLEAAATDLIVSEIQSAKMSRLVLMALAEMDEVKENDPKISRVFSSLQNYAHTFKVLCLLEEVDGKIVATDGRDVSFLSKSELNFINKYMYSNQLSSAILNIGDSTSSPTWTYIYPISTNSKKRIILYASQSLAVEQKHKNYFQTKNIGLAQIYNVHGNIYNSNFSLPNVDISDEENKNILSIINSNEANQGCFFYDIDGYTLLFAYSKGIIEDNMPPLASVLATDAKQIYTNKYQTIFANIIFLIGIMSFAFIISLRISKKNLSNPIEKLLAAAQRLKLGDFSVHLSMANMAKEFTILGSSMNTIATTLKAKGEELVKAKEAAEDANKTKGEFLATISHEIRTPMNSILGMAYLALRTPLTLTQQNYINKIHSEGVKLLAVINAVLDFSKIEAGKMHLEQIPFSLQSSIIKFLEDSRNVANRKNLSLNAEIDTEIAPSFIGDPFHISQCLNNLIQQCILEAQSGTIVFRCKLESKNETSQLIKFIISNIANEEGSGEHEKNEKFSFSTQDNSSQLSMAVAKRIIEMMNGDLSINKDLFGNNTYSFIIPLSINTDSSKDSSQISSFYSKFKLLVLDSALVQNSLLVSMLQSLSLQPKTFSNHQDLLSELKNSEDPSNCLVFIEYIIANPEQNILHLIRKDFIPPLSPKIVLLLKGGREELLQQAEKSGADILLYSPFDASSLFNSIQQISNGEFVEKSGGDSSSTSGKLEKSLEGTNVLLVEDNIVNQQIAEEILEGAGVKVTTADNGKIAVELANKVSSANPYNIILMDLQMPEMDGFEAAKEIRNIPGFESIPIIAMTAHTKDEEWDKCVAVGMSDFATKPIHVEELFSTLRKWINAEKSN